MLEFDIMCGISILLSSDLWDEVGQYSRHEEDEMFKHKDEHQPTNQNLQHF